MGGRRFLIFLVALGLAVPPARAMLPLQQIFGFEQLDSPRADASSVLRLYFMPTAPVKLKWGSPRGLLLSAVEAMAFDRSHPIGHVNIEVQLRGLDDAAHHQFIGATDAGSGVSRKLLLHDEMAFSILERAWPGKLETEPEMAQSVCDRAVHRDRLAVATFLISDATCQRLLGYCHALRADQNPRWYGFSARPLREEGSGCSAFGASFVELAGLLDAATRGAWVREIRVPLSLMAGYAGVEKLSVARAVVSGAAADWAKPGDPHMLLEFFDPDRMFDWTEQLHDHPAEVNGLAVHADPDLPRLLDQRYHLGGAAARNVKAIAIDARDVATPSGSVFSGAPDLEPKSDTQTPTVIRRHKVVEPNGTFELRP